MPTYKWVATVNLFLCVIMAFLLSIFLTVGQGQHLSLEGWTFTLAVAFVASLVIAFIVPLPKMGAWFATQICGKDQGGGVFYLVDSAMQVAGFLVCVNLIMTIALSGTGDINGMSFIDRWWIMNLNFWAVAYICFLVARPISTALATKIWGDSSFKAPAGENA